MENDHEAPRHALPPIPSLSVEITDSRAPEFYCYHLAVFSQSPLDIRQTASTRSAPLPSSDIQSALNFQRSFYSFDFLSASLRVSDFQQVNCHATTNRDQFGSLPRTRFARSDGLRVERGSTNPLCSRKAKELLQA